MHFQCETNTTVQKNPNYYSFLSPETAAIKFEKLTVIILKQQLCIKIFFPLMMMFNVLAWQCKNSKNKSQYYDS